MDHPHALTASSAAFMPHGHCYLWTPGILWLEVIANAAVAAAYYSIPVVLYLIVRGRKDLPYPHVFMLFALFITSCGTGHLIDVITIWHPIYWVKAFWDAVTAAISVATAVVLAPLLPRLLKAGSIEAYVQAQAIETLERQNRELEAAHAAAEQGHAHTRAQMEAMGRATTVLAERESRIAADLGPLAAGLTYLRLAFGLGLIVGAVAYGVALWRGVLVPLQRVRAALAGLARGEYRQAAELPAEGAAELAEMATSVRAVGAQLQATVDDFQRSAATNLAAFEAMVSALEDATAVAAELRAAHARVEAEVVARR